METKDLVTFATWAAAIAAAILATTIWLISQHTASIHPSAISTYQFEEFRQASREFKENFNQRMTRLEQQIQRLEAEIKTRSPKSRFYESFY